MGTLWLYAMPLDEVRAFFAAPAGLAEELLSQAADVMPDPTPSPLIGKVGPLFRRQVAPIMDLPVPTSADARALVAGRALPPDRLGPAWVIVRHWCDVRSRARLTMDVELQQLASLDFCLVSRGLSSQYSTETVLTRDPHLPLRPLAGLKIGWMPNHHVAQAFAQWRDAIAGCDVPDSALVPLRDQLAGFFGRFPEFSGQTPPPDVLAMYQ